MYNTQKEEQDLEQFLDTDTSFQEEKQPDLSLAKSEMLEIELLNYKIKHIWAERTQQNIVFVSRAICWLKDGCNNNDSFDLLNKLLCLGKILSEESISNEVPSNYCSNKEEAINQRNNLVSSKDNMEILNNKTHLQHKSLMERLNRLNSIIANAN